MTNAEDRAPLDAAEATWNAAIEAMHRDIGRIARGGTPDVEATSRLLAAVETARRRYEEQLAPLKA